MLNVRPAWRLLLAWTITVGLAGAVIAQDLPAAGDADLPPGLIELRQRIATLIEELVDPHPDIRERATLALIDIGPPCVGMLRQAMAEADIPEMRMRGGRILREIPQRWQHFSADGGEVMGGFQAILTSRARYERASAVAIQLEIRNVGPTTKRLADIRGVDFELPDAGVTFTSPHADGRVILRRLDAADQAGNGQGDREGRALIWERGPMRQIEFRTGGSLSTSIPLGLHLQLTPGEYEVSFVYYARTRQLIADAWDDLSSNAVRFRVE